MFLYQPHLIVKYLVYFLFVWFFISLFSRKNRGTNITLFSMYLINSFWFKEIGAEWGTIEYKAEYILNKEFIATIDTFFGLMIFALNKSKLSKCSRRQFELIGFVVLCHCMVLLHLTVGKSWLTVMFYSYYDELIIIGGLLQIWVSRDGTLTVIRRAKSFNYRLWVRHVYSSKVYFSRKKRKG